MTDQRISLEKKQELLDRLLSIRELNEPEARQLYLSELEQQLGRPLGVGRYNQPRLSVLALLNACLGDADALRAFAKVIRALHGEHRVAADLDQLVQEMVPPLLSPIHRESLAALVAEMDTDALRDSYHEVLGVGANRTPDWSSPATVVGHAERSSAGAGGLPLFLAFVERLAHTRADPPRTERLHEWISLVASDYHVGPLVLKGLCPAPSQDAAEPEVVSLESSPDGSSGGQSSNTEETQVNRASVGTQPTLDAQRVIWGGVPGKNPIFTGREKLISKLRDALVTRSKASVLPQTLHGLGGVGKTQLAIEYVYRHADQYELIWWLTAERPAEVRASLAELGRRLEVPASEDINQTAANVLDALATSSLRWLLVYDNADRPEDVATLVPSAGGHVILTSRNHDWTSVYDAIEVDVFDRAESIQLLRRRGAGITTEEADMLAAKLGDLPLALEQAAGWQAATGMQVSRYLELFDAHVSELLSENKPPQYSATVSAFLSVAFEKLRTGDVPAAGQLLELFAFLGPEPVSAGLLRSGRGPHVSSPLAEALGNEILMSRAIRELRRCALAKVETDGQLIHVHRLVQLVLREGLRKDRRDQSLANVRLILASANPGVPDDQKSWPIHAEIGPHIAAANLIGADAPEARQVVLDQVRYLFRRGDYASSRDLAEQMVQRWSAEPDRGGLGPDHEQTLLAKIHLANASRVLGDHNRARELGEDVLKRLQNLAEFGDLHEHTVAVGFGLGFDLRITGNLRQALRRDEENVTRAKHIYGDDDEKTLHAQLNVAAGLRTLGRYAEAFKIDTEVVEQYRVSLGRNHVKTLWAVGNLGRDLYGLGRYAEALDSQRTILPTFLAQYGPRHRDVLLSARTIAIALRKLGRYGEALSQARENYRAFHQWFGPEHEHTLAATMSYANTLRAVGELDEARGLAETTVAAYESVFGARNPLTLCAGINRSIILREAGDWRTARALAQRTYDAMRETVGDEHPHTLCAATDLANSIVLDRDRNAARDSELAGARELTQQTYRASLRTRGNDHPYTLACALNAALDMKAVGHTDEGEALLGQTLATMERTLGGTHPDTLHAAQERRADCDVEPPPM